MAHGADVTSTSLMLEQAAVQLALEHVQDDH